MQLTTEQEAVLTKLKVRSFQKDLRLVSEQTLEREFGAESTGRILATRLIRNIVFQAATWIVEEKAAKIEGNLLSLYYQWVAPVLSKISVEDRPVASYRMMCDVLQVFVTDLKLFCYRDLELVDEKWENRWFTDGRNPHLLVFAEGLGFMILLQEIQRDYGVTTLSLDGAPNLMGTEYLVEKLKKKVGTIEPLVLIGITNYTPNGFAVSNAFQEQLVHQGIEIATFHNLIEPEHYTKRELEYFSCPLPQTDQKKIEDWMKETNGIGGRAAGLEADSMPKSRLQKLLNKQLKPYLREL